MTERTKTTIPPLVLLSALRPRERSGPTITPEDLREAAGQPVACDRCRGTGHITHYNQTGEAPFTASTCPVCFGASAPVAAWPVLAPGAYDLHELVPASQQPETVSQHQERLCEQVKAKHQTIGVP